MSAQITFNPYLGWVDATDPLNIPADLHLITAADLLRYENFAAAARDKINEVAGIAEQNATTVGQHTQTLTSHTQSISDINQTLGQNSTAIGNNTSAIGTLQGDVSTLKALTGPVVKTSKAFDLTVAGGAKTVATVTGGTNYTSFELEVTTIGRTASGPFYSKVVRYVRPENGTPVYLTVGTDVVSGGIGLSFSTSGTSGVNVVATPTGVDAFATVHVEAKGGAGASSAANRNVTVAMA